MGKLDLKNWSAEKISQRVFMLLLLCAVVVFMLFFLVGYDMPFEENPDFIAPLFTNLLLILIWGLLMLALGMAFFSVVRGYRKSVSSMALENGIPKKKIFRITWGATLTLLLLSFLFGSSAPMLVNGSEFVDWAWLKVSDMFVVTSSVMLVAAVFVVLYGSTRYVRRERK